MADVVDIDITLGLGLVINRVKYMLKSVSHFISTRDSNISPRAVGLILVEG